MIIHFDGGLRKNLIAIVNEETDEVLIEKRKYDNDDYEWDALEMALDYVKQMRTFEDVELVGDNNQVIRWIQEDKPIADSVIKQKCLEKLDSLRNDNKYKRVVGSWVKRNENLAGRALEYWTSRSSKPTQFRAKWHSCPRCVYKSLSEKQKEQHFYNNHVTNG
jgi:ribonuclease HI